MPGASQGCGAAVGEEGSLGGVCPALLVTVGTPGHCKSWAGTSGGHSGCAEGVCSGYLATQPYQCSHLHHESKIALEL